MFKNGELSEARQLISLFIKKILVHDDYIELQLNVLPTMGHLPNINEFVSTATVKNQDSELSILKIDKKDLISWGKRIFEKEMTHGNNSMCHRISSHKMATNGAGERT